MRDLRSIRRLLILRMMRSAPVNGRVLSHEREPQMDVLPLGTLVGDVSEDGHHALLAVSQQIAQYVFLGIGVPWERMSMKSRSKI